MSFQLLECAMYCGKLVVMHRINLLGSHWITISTITKTAFSKENNSGTFVSFLAEGYPSGVCLKKVYNSSRAAGSKNGKVCRARSKSMDVDGRTTFWTLEHHAALPLALDKNFLLPCPSWALDSDPLSQPGDNLLPAVFYWSVSIYKWMSSAGSKS